MGSRKTIIKEKKFCFRKTEKVETNRKHKVMVKKVVLLQSLKFQSRATREADCFIRNRCNSQILVTSALLLRVYSILRQSSEDLQTSDLD